MLESSDRLFDLGMIKRDEFAGRASASDTRIIDGWSRRWGSWWWSAGLELSTLTYIRMVSTEFESRGVDQPGKCNFVL